MNTNGNSGMNRRQNGGRRDRVNHPGYSPVLIQTKLKDEIRDFRHKNGLGYDTHIERCLVSAAIHLLLERSDLQSQWLEVLGEMVKLDIQLTSSVPHQVRGPVHTDSRPGELGPKPLDIREALSPSRK